MLSPICVMTCFRNTSHSGNSFQMIRSTTNKSAEQDIKLSIVTVVRNGATVIGDCLQSVADQKVDRIEHIIIDGASTDDTLSVITGHETLVPTQIVSEPDRGLYDAMNKGLRLARGRFVHFLNADDSYASSDILLKILACLRDDHVCYGQIIYRDHQGRDLIRGAEFNRDKEMRASQMPQPSMFVPKRFYDDVGRFDLGYRIAADYDMVLRLTARYPVHFLGFPTTIMRAGGLSDQQALLGFREARNIARAHGRSLLAGQLDYLLKLVKWHANRLPGAFMLRKRSASESVRGS